MRALPREELWDLEEKYDVHIDACYGAERICHVAPLAAFLVLNWDRQSDEPLQFNEVDLSQRRDLLAAIMKSPGPFFQHAQGPFHEAQTPFDEAAYLQALQGVTIYEACGQVDFKALSDLYIDSLSAEPCAQAC